MASVIQYDLFEDPLISQLRARITNVEFDNKKHVAEIKKLKKQIKELNERLNLIEYGLSIN